MEINVVVDRFEGMKAVLLAGEEEVAVVWPKNLLPKEVKEGDIIKLILWVDTQATSKAKEEAERLLQQIQEENS